MTGRVFEAWQAVTAAYRASDPVSSDSLHYVAQTARRARTCFEETNSDRRVWLLYRETWSLDQLRRYQEADSLIRLFRDEFESAADTLYRARFALFRVRYVSFTGRIDSTERALEQAQPIIRTLPYSDQAHATLTGASLLLESGQHQKALDLINEILGGADVANQTGEFGVGYVQARARSLRADVQLDKALRNEAINWSLLAQEYEEVASLYLDLGRHSRYSAVLAKLGEVYTAADQQHLAEERIAEAMAVAAVEADPRAEIYTLYRRGRIRIRQGAYHPAQQDFMRGLLLTDSSGIEKYRFDLLFELARLNELRGGLAEAQRSYEAITERRPAFNEGAIRAISLKATAHTRVRDVERLLLRERKLLRIAVGAALLIILFVVTSALVSRKRQVEAADLATRLAGNTTLLYLEEIVSNPKGAASIIQAEDRHLARRLGRQRLRGKMELYDCLAFLHNHVAGTSLNGHAARMRLHRLFKKEGWQWPEGDNPLEAWRSFFDQQDLRR